MEAVVDTAARATSPKRCLRLVFQVSVPGRRYLLYRLYRALEGLNDLRFRCFDQGADTLYVGAWLPNPVLVAQLFEQVWDYSAESPETVACAQFTLLFADGRCRPWDVADGPPSLTLQTQLGTTDFVDHTLSFSFDLAAKDLRGGTWRHAVVAATSKWTSELNMFWTAVTARCPDVDVQHSWPGPGPQTLYFCVTSADRRACVRRLVAAVHAVVELYDLSYVTVHLLRGDMTRHIWDEHTCELVATDAGADAVGSHAWLVNTVPWIGERVAAALEREQASLSDRIRAALDADAEDAPSPSPPPPPLTSEAVAADLASTEGVSQEDLLALAAEPHVRETKRREAAQWLGFDEWDFDAASDDQVYYAQRCLCRIGDATRVALPCDHLALCTKCFGRIAARRPDLLSDCVKCGEPVHGYEMFDEDM